MIPLRTKILSSLLLALTTLSAHEHWLITDFPQYAQQDSITIRLRSGHTPGKSEFLIKTDLIQESFLMGPDGKQSPLDFLPHEKEHICTFLGVQPGIYTVYVNLRKRSKGPFTYLLKTTLQVGDLTRSESSTLPQELEIVNGNSELILQVSTLGQPMKVPISSMSEDQAIHSLTMNSNGVSTLDPDQIGFHVAICHFRRQAASYSFYLGQ